MNANMSMNVISGWTFVFVQSVSSVNVVVRAISDRQVFYAGTRPRSKHRVCLYGERAYFELSVLTSTVGTLHFSP